MKSRSLGCILKVFILASFSAFLTVNSFSAECERLGGSIASGQLRPRLPHLQHARHLPRLGKYLVSGCSYCYCLV